MQARLQSGGGCGGGGWGGYVKQDKLEFGVENANVTILNVSFFS